MSRLSDQIQKLIDPFPGSFSELARSAGIDRSTLYKIANGKRLPTHRQLKTLFEVCHATPQQQQDITQSFRLITTDSATQERNIHLQTLLEAFLHSPTLNAATIPDDVPKLNESSLLTNFNDIQLALTSALRRYLSAPSAMPLMISPRLPSILCNCLLQTAASCPASHEIWQFTMIVPYSGNDDSYSSLSALAETLPLLYANTMQYRGRLFYEDSPLSQRPDILFPHYLLLPDQAFLFDQSVSVMYCIRDCSVVEYLRLRFTQEYLRAKPYLMQYTSSSVPAGVLAQVGGIPNPEIALCYFSESSLLAFTHNTAISPVLRQKRLHSLRQQCLNGSLVRLVDQDVFPLSADHSIHITAERHLLVQHKIPSGIRRYELLDKDITDAILQYLHVLEGSPLLHTRQYTIDFIDCCLRIISK